MTREDAEREAARLGREHPDRERSSWIASDDGAGGWRVLKVSAPGASLARKPTHPGELAAEPRPSPDQMPPSEPRREWMWGAG
jgi:hypothetical protein